MTEIVIPPGLQRGATPADRPGTWYDSNLVRWTDGVLHPVGGWERLTSAPMASTIRRLHTWRDNADVLRFACATDAGLLLLDGTTWSDITPAGYTGPGGATGLPTGHGVGAYGAEDYGDARSAGSALFLRGANIAFDTWGEILMVCSSSDGRALLWNPAAPLADASAVPNAPTGNQALVVTRERHLMLCGANGNKRRIQWSAREDYSAWAPTGENQAGDIDLDADAQIMTAREAREGVLVWTEADLHLVSWVGGEYVYGRERLGSTTLLSPHAIAEFGGRCAWMTRHGQFHLYDASQIRPLPCPIAARVAAEIEPVAGAARAHAAHNPLHSEVWFFYPTKSAAEGECDRAAVWNYQDDIWSTHALARSAMHPSGPHRFPLMGGTDRHLYEHENGSLAAGATRVGAVWAESGALTPGGQARVQRMQLDGGVVNRTSVTIAARDTRDGSDTTYGPFTPNADGRTPVRAGGQDLRLRIAAATDDPAWSIGRALADVVPIGQR